MKKRITFLMVAACLFAACNSDKKDEATDKKDATTSENKEAMASAATSNKAEKNKQTALACIMAINSHDADAVLKDVTPDAIDYSDGSLPPTKGVDSIKAGFKAWMNAFPDVKGENLMATSDADGSHVVVVGQWSSTFKNDFMGIKATGKTAKYWDADVFTFNSDGKMTEHRYIQSNASVMMQLGAKMPK